MTYRRISANAFTATDIDEYLYSKRLEIIDCLYFLFVVIYQCVPELMYFFLNVWILFAINARKCLQQVT